MLNPNYDEIIKLRTQLVELNMKNLKLDEFLIKRSNKYLDHAKSHENNDIDKKMLDELDLIRAYIATNGEVQA